MILFMSLKYISFKDSVCSNIMDWIIRTLKGTKNPGLNVFLKHAWDFPGGAVVKNPPAKAGDTGSSPGPGRSHMPWSN